MALKDGLLHWWELDTTAWLDSHGSWNLTPRKDSGGADPSINATGGPDGGPCLSLDGTNYLDRTDVAWDGSGAARSVQIWARYSSLSDIANLLLSHRTGNLAISQLFFSTARSGASRTLWGDSAETTVAFGETANAADTWYHILATTNGTTRHKIWVNGELDAESTAALNGTAPTGNIAFAIGAASYYKLLTTQRHSGLACLAAIWQREVSESEVVQLYNGGAGRRYAALDMVSSGAKIARLRRAHAENRGMRA